MSFTEVEKFITANTQELAKDKWLCPLSGKKFKGQEFVRKHILAKHMEKVEEVKQEVKCAIFFWSTASNHIWSQHAIYNAMSLHIFVTVQLFLVVDVW